MFAAFGGRRGVELQALATLQALQTQKAQKASEQLQLLHVSSVCLWQLIAPWCTGMGLRTQHRSRPCERGRLNTNSTSNLFVRMKVAAGTGLTSPLAPPLSI